MVIFFEFKERIFWKTQTEVVYRNHIPYFFFCLLTFGQILEKWRKVIKNNKIEKIEFFRHPDFFQFEKINPELLYVWQQSLEVWNHKPKRSCVRICASTKSRMKKLLLCRQTLSSESQMPKTLTSLIFFKFKTTLQKALQNYTITRTFVRESKFWSSGIRFLPVLDPMTLGSCSRMVAEVEFYL